MWWHSERSCHMAKWFLVRHGATAWNKEGRAQGQTDTPLDDSGHQQAARIGARLESTSFDAAYTSDLSRVVQTAEPIMKGRSIALQHVIELREKRYGEWEGKTFTEVEAQYPDYFKRLFDDDITFAPPGGESDQDVFNRVGSVAERLKEAHTGDENILVTGHGGSLRALITKLLDLSATHMWRFRLDNAGLSIITTYPKGGMTLDLLNDTNHLDTPPL